MRQWQPTLPYPPLVEEPTSSVFILLYTYTILPVLTAPLAFSSLISNSWVKVWQLEYVQKKLFKKQTHKNTVSYKGGKKTIIEKIMRKYQLEID